MVKRKLAMILILTGVILLGGCGRGEDGAPAGRIHDNDGVYSLAKGEAATLFINVAAGDSVPFFRVSGEDRENGAKITFPITVFDQEGTLGSEQIPAAGTLQIKGNQAYRGNYRSFKISFDEEDKYRDQSTLLLYKNPGDAARITMRLGMDAYALCDDIVSTRTGFVHLQVNDAAETGGDPYEDYGLYIMAENPGGKYLRTHGLDRNGELYEIKNFGLDYQEWFNAGESGREELAEHKNGSDPEKFSRMLKAIDTAEDLDEVFDTYFDRQNYLTWIAASILLGNYQAGRENFLLYSPTDSEKWYFFPLPTDKLLQEETDRRWSTPPESYAGLGWFMDNVIHNRFFQNQKNRQELAAKTDEIRAVLNDRVITSYCEEYKKVLADFVTRKPDYAMLHFTPEETWARIDRIPENIAGNYELFEMNRKLPLPFAPEEIRRDEAGGYLLSWQPAVSEEEVRYHVKITGDLAGEEVLFETVTTGLMAEIPAEIKGFCYIHLNAENPFGIQPMNRYVKGQEASLWGITGYEFGNSGGWQ